MRSGNAPSAWTWAGLGLITLAVAAAGALFAGEETLFAWRQGILSLAALSAGSLVLLCIGHLLANNWVESVRDELEPASWTLGVIAVLAIPLIGVGTPDAAAIIPEVEMTGARATWFSPGGIVLRTLLVFAAWIAAAGFVAAHGENRLVSALALGATASGFVVASADWVLLSVPFWWSTLLPFALLVTQMGAGLALAFVTNIAQREQTDEAAFRSLSTGLLGLALLIFWVWFAQYLVAWFGNQPDESAWYVLRTAGIGTPLLIAWATGLAIAVTILILTRRRTKAMLWASGALFVSHLAGMTWLLFPASANPPTIGSAALIAGLSVLWLAWLWAGQRLYDATHPPPDGSPADGSPSGS